MLLLQPLGVGLSFSKVWLSWKQGMFKIIASFASENNGQKRLFSGVDRSNIIILPEQGYSERQISEKLKFSQDCNPSILPSSTFKWSNRDEALQKYFS